MAVELRLEQVRFENPNGLVVGPLTLRLAAGIWRVTGTAGKTTLLRLLGGDLPPSSGKILWNSLNLYRKEAARRDVALVLSSPEQPDFFTVEEAWKTAATLRGRGEWDGLPLQDALELEGEARLGSLPPAIRRRAELLAALAGDPTLVALDEVLADLNPRGQEALISLLQLGRSRRLVLITHTGDLPLQPDGELLVPSWRRQTG